jgi:hypothetical protein
MLQASPMLRKPKSDSGTHPWNDARNPKMIEMAFRDHPELQQ